MPAKWSKEENQFISTALGLGHTNKAIAKGLNRTLSAVETHLTKLRKEGKLPPARQGRRPIPESFKDLDVGSDEKGSGLVALDSADLAHAIFIVGGLLPASMQVTFYRPENAPESTAIEVTHPDGEKSRHWVGQVAH